jgi:hypothetical protein
MKQSVKVCLVATFLAASLTSGVQAAPKDSGRGSLWTAWGSWVEGWVAWWSQATVHAPQGIWPDPHGRSPDPAPQGSLPDPTGRGTAAVSAPQGSFPDPHGRSTDTAPHGSWPDPDGR